MFYNGGVSVSGVAIIIVEGIVEVRSEDCHVLGSAAMVHIVPP
jgi:hypothetical protein